MDPDEVEVGETIIVRPGEKIPLDGVILEGSTAVNTAALTGESLPQDKAEGDPVVSGTVNLTGVITVQTQSAYGESTAAKILELVENAADQKARVESFITRFAHWYTPCVVIGAALLAVIPPLFFSQPWGTWVERALVFLVVSCPCALVVSVPLTFFGGIGGASRCGILVKGAGYMETLAKAKTVVFDKTGTLTKGSFTVTHIVPAAGTEDDLLATAAAAESFSHHPIAQSVVAAYGKPIEKEIEDAKDHTGRGIEAVIDGRHIYAGNERLMKEIGVPCREVAEVGTVIHMAADNDYLGYLVIADTPKPDSAEAIRTLKAEGVEKTVMLTGDKTAVAQAVAGELGLDEYRAELLPADKVTAVEELLQTGSPLVFVGDGINDAPVLARADVGVAMGALGSDAAIEAADIVLMDDAPSKLALAVRLSRRTMKIVWQNVIFALAVKALVLVLGATGDANMWIAVFADVGVLVLAILNAMRALLVPQALILSMFFFRRSALPCGSGRPFLRFYPICGRILSSKTPKGGRPCERSPKPCLPCGMKNTVPSMPPSCRGWRGSASSGCGCPPCAAMPPPWPKRRRPRSSCGSCPTPTTRKIISMPCC